MKKAKKLVALVLTLVVVLSCLTGVSFAEEEPVITIQSATPTHEITGDKSTQAGQAIAPQYADDELVRAIIVLEGDAVAAASDSERTATKRKLQDQHVRMRSAIKSAQISFTKLFDYTSVLNGMAIEVAYGDLDKIAALPGVQHVYISNTYTIPKDTVQMSSSNVLTGVDMAHSSFYDGSGIVIAVLDSGITPTHEAFQVYPGMLAQAAISQSKAEERISTLGHGTYLSQKIPFSYDYADQDNDATDDGKGTGGHGTHVSGTAVGYALDEDNAVTFSGAAPDAQLLAMKVFSSSNSTTSSDIYFAALEDAYALGADIVNMSLGAPNGFTYDSSLETELFGNVFETLENAGILCVTSAGNRGSQADYANSWNGTGNVLSSYTEYGTLGSPSTYDGNTSVASAENAEYPAYIATVGEEQIAYNDSTEDNAFAAAMGGKTYDYVMVPNLGETADYEGIDVTGKVAVISRGDINFEDKVNNAAAAGAVAAIIYNNTEGSIGMQITAYAVPAVSVTQAAGEIFAEGNGSVSFSVDRIVIDNPDSGTISVFSSWGATNDLTLKPTITGIGGMVNSAAYQSTDNYVVMSGTSMATPDVAGCYASLIEALKNSFLLTFAGKDEAMKKAMTEPLAQSTAQIMLDADGIPYSPRQQGAGLININNATLSASYIEDPICSLGDNQDGVFNITFTLSNYSMRELQYDISVDVLADVIEEVGYPDSSMFWITNYHYYNTLTSRKLVEGVDYTLSTAYDNNAVKTSGTTEVTVTITLSAECKAAMDKVSPNGSYVEGYVHLAPHTPDGTMTFTPIHATYMGYYGDWESGDIQESADWRRIVDIEYDLHTYPVGDGTDNTLSDYGKTYLDVCKDYDLEITTDVSAAILFGLSFPQNYSAYAGDNMLDHVWGYNDNRIALTNSAADNSPFCTMLISSPQTLRNARRIIMVVSDATTGEVYYTEEKEYVPKSSYDTDAQYWKSFSTFGYDGNDANGAPLPNNTKLSIDYYAELAYGEDTLSQIATADLKAQAKDYLVWNYPCTIDNTMPVIDETTASYNSETGALTLNITDNQYLASVKAYDGDGNLLDSKCFSDNAAGKTSTVMMNIGAGLTSVNIAALDYATNMNYSRVQLVTGPAAVRFHLPEGISLNGASVLDTTIGSFVNLPMPLGTIDGYTFVGWAAEEYPTATDKEDIGLVYKPYAYYEVVGDMDFYALYEKVEGEVPATEALRRVTVDSGYWEGTFAIEGNVIDTGSIDEYLLNADTTALNCKESGVTTDASGMTYLYGAPEDAIFTFTETDPSMLEYTIRSNSTGKYLAMDATAPNGLAMLDNGDSDAARWRVGCAQTFQVFWIRNKTDDTKMLVFDNADCSFKVITGGLYEIAMTGGKMNLCLFGTSLLYSYTTAPELPDTIADALAADAGESFKVKGVVTMVDGKNVYMQDATGGICAYFTAVPAVALGDTLVVSGIRATYNGLPVLTDAVITTSSSGMRLTAKETTIAALTSADVCTYVSLSGLIITDIFDNNGAYAKPNITVTDGTNTIQLYKAVVGGEIAVGDILTVKAAVGCYNGTLQLRNTAEAEITKTGVHEHSWNDGEATTPATCTEAGVKTFTCTVCGETKTETINMLAHTPAVDSAVAATCTATGLTEGSHCSVCNTVLVAQKTVAALGHAWDEGKVTTDPTATTEGVKTYTCTVCGETKTETIPATGGEELPFTDVAKGKWYYEAVKFAYVNKLFGGTTATSFTPDGNMTRGMLVTVLWRLDGKTAPKGSNGFTDVAADKYYTEAVTWAAENKIVGGVGDNKFNPDGNVTREQIAAILFRYAAFKGCDTSKTANLSGFPDSGKISAYAKAALSWATAEGLINGTSIGGTAYLDPQGNATRAQVATMMMRYVNNIVNK